MAEDKDSVIKEKPGFDFRIILIGLLLFLVAMGASYLIMRSLIAPLMPASNNNQAEILSGNLIEVGEFTTNINSDTATRFLKVNVTVETVADDKKAGESINKFMPIIRDCIIGILAAQNVADLDESNRNNLKQEIKKNINSKIGGDLVKNVYFTDFIMQ